MISTCAFSPTLMSDIMAPSELMDARVVRLGLNRSLASAAVCYSKYTQNKTGGGRAEIL